MEKYEHALYECALAVEQDSRLGKEMTEWNVTVRDGLTEDISHFDYIDYH
jgi:hypothetical protein